MARRKSAAAKQGEQNGEVTRDVNAAVRVATALRMAIEGHDWKSIADGAGYSGGPGTAFNAVQRELRRTLKPLAEEYRTIEVLRLDSLLTVYYPKAMNGDGWSMDRVLRIMERRSSLLGLDMQANNAAIAAQLLVRTYDAETGAV